MNHLLLGMAIPFLVFAIIYVARRFRATLGMIVAAPLLMGAMAVWAIVPDIPRMVGMQELYIRMSLDKGSDMFLWHHAIDLIESDSPLYLAGLVILMVSMLAVAWRELMLKEKELELNDGR